MSTEASTPAQVDRADLLRVIGASLVVAIPISLVAMGFLELINAMQTWVWQSAPSALGYETAPWWWAIPWLVLAGALVAAAISTFPGRGGHIPAHGTAGAPILPQYVPGVLLAALASLPFGAVLGPEAPLIGMGTGLAVWLSRVIRLSPGGRIEALIGIAGSAAAIGIILGNPLTAVVFMAEGVALMAGPVIAATIAALLGVGAGAVLFTGLGDLPGVQAQSLQLVELDSIPVPELGDLLWAVPFGVVAALVMTGIFAAGLRLEAVLHPMTRLRLVAATMLAGLMVALCASAYSLLTGRTPFDVASSGSATLAELTSDAASWSSAALIALLIFKGLAYAVSLGSFRGGAIFPSIMLGGTLGALLAPLPGLGLAGGLAVGMAAFASAGMMMPLSSVALTILLFGPNAPTVFPEVAIAAVTAFAVRVAIQKRQKVAAAGTGPTGVGAARADGSQGTG